MSEKETIRNCPTHGNYIYPRWTRCELCPTPPLQDTGARDKAMKLVTDYSSAVWDAATIAAGGVVESTTEAVEAEVQRSLAALRDALLAAPTQGTATPDGLPWTVDDTATLRRVFTAIGQAFPVSNEIPDSHLIRYVRVAMAWILGPETKAQGTAAPAGGLEAAYLAAFDAGAWYHATFHGWDKAAAMESFSVYVAKQTLQDSPAPSQAPAAEGGNHG